MVGGEAGNEDIKKGKELSTKNKSELICLLKKENNKNHTKETNKPTPTKPKEQRRKPNQENPTK